MKEPDRRKWKGCVHAGHFIIGTVFSSDGWDFFSSRGLPDRVGLKRRRLCAAKCLVEVRGQRSER